MTVRHLLKENQELLTSYGKVKLGRSGLVTNLAELGKNAAEKLLTLPDFESTNIFPIEGLPSSGETNPEELAKSNDPLPTLNRTEQAQRDVLRDLQANPKNLNSAGKVDMGRLNNALKGAELPILTGADRDRLTQYP